MADSNGANQQYDDSENHERAAKFDEARKRVQTPGTILMVFGVISIFIAMSSLGAALFGADQVYGWLWDKVTEMQQNQPQGQPNPMGPRDAYIQQSKIQGIAGGALSLICSFLIIIGASKMKQLSGYGLAMTGSILAIIPCTNSCCCLSIPFGVWTLIILINADVKSAFSAAAARQASPDY